MSNVRMESCEAACTDPVQNDPDCLLLALPLVVLHQVLDLLGARDLLTLMHTSTAMALEVMQHCASRLTFRVVLCKGLKLAGIQQLIQAPSGIKLVLDGQFQASSDWDSFLYAWREALPAPTSYPGQHIQQLACISQVCIRGASLPSLVPAGLVDMCPNMQTLHLCGCFIQDAEQGKNSKSGSSSSSKTDCRTACGGGDGSSSSSSSMNGPAMFTGVNSATHLRTLVLDSLRGGLNFSAGAARVLISSLPNMTCLKPSSSGEVQMISMFGPQLTELHVSDMKRWGASMHLPQLQKLVMPYAEVAERSMKQLLGLPNLAHLEVASLRVGFAVDYSSYPCKWQSLHLHLPHQGLRIVDLAQLPLHSLVQPLRLGRKKSGCMYLRLPSSIEGAAVFTRLKRLAQCLMKCGVQVMEPQVAWLFDFSRDLGYLPRGAQHAATITLLAPAFGLHTHVALKNVVVDEQIMAALAAVYQDSLRHLTAVCCDFLEDMLPAWHATLSNLPALGRVELQDFWADDEESAVKEIAQGVIGQLAAAMAQQPAGRCIEVLHSNTVEVYISPFELAQLARDGAGALLTDVEVTERGYDVGYTGSHAGPCICITSKHMPSASSC